MILGVKKMRKIQIAPPPGTGRFYTRYGKLCVVVFDIDVCISCWTFMLLLRAMINF